jgi:hypothetical protein
MIWQLRHACDWNIRRIRQQCEHNGRCRHDGNTGKYQSGFDGKHDGSCFFVERRGQSADCVARSQEQGGVAKIERRSIHHSRDGPDHSNG